MATSNDIFYKVNEYITRRITLEDLESWLVNMLPVYLLNPDSDEANLAGTIELGLAEISADIRSERSLRTLLAKQIINKPIKNFMYIESDCENITSSRSSFIESASYQVLPDPSQSWHTEPQVEYV